MEKVQLTIAIGDYDHTRDVTSGVVPVQGASLIVLNLEPEDEKLPQNVQKQKDILERVEFMTRTEPINIANLIKTWLHEEKIRENNGGGGKKKQTAGKD